MAGTEKPITAKEAVLEAIKCSTDAEMTVMLADAYETLVSADLAVAEFEHHTRHCHGEPLEADTIQ